VDKRTGISVSVLDGRDYDANRATRLQQDPTALKVYITQGIKRFVVTR
jgi:hypothetical protein